jgi:hypothetical protein
VLLVGAVSAVPASLAGQSSDPLQRFLAAPGLEDLSDDQRERVATLVTLTARGYEQRLAAAAPAVAYVRNQGYGEAWVGLVRADSRWSLVVGGPHAVTREYTTDIPLGLDVYRFANGSHFVKKGLLSGIDELIAQDGRVHRFTLARWLPVR